MTNTSYSVLIVDDIMSNIQVIGNILRSHKINTYAAMSGERALYIASDTHLDLILLDVSMPGMDGYEVCQRLKTNEKTRDIPVIFLTAHTQQEDVVKGFELGAVDYITKPFNSAELVKRVFNHMQLKHARDTIASQKAKLEEQNHRLREINASKDKFFSVIAHDLKNPFNTVLGFSSFLKNHFFHLDSEKTLKYIDLIHRNADNGYKLLENLLNWARAQTNRLSVHPEEIAVYDAVKEVIAFYEEGYSNKNVTAKNQVAKNQIAYVDQNVLMTILRNIISNAYKFSFPGSEILINATTVQNEICISVTDYGKGIPPEKQAKLFKVEETISEKGTNSEEGTGLGLIIANEFAEKSNGRIEVESETGKGTTFKVFLPASVGT